VKAGHSVMLHVKDFLHYLYVAAPVRFTPQDCQSYKIYLEAQIGNYSPVIHSVGIVMRENLYGYAGNQANPYIKITVTDPKHIAKLRSKLEAPGGANWKGMWTAGGGEGILTFDSVQYILRFMVDLGVSTVLVTSDISLTLSDFGHVLG